MIPSLAVAVLHLAPQEPPAQVAAFLERHCVECHDGDVAKGGLNLLAAPADIVSSLARWSHVRERVVAGEMPPADKDRPEVDERRSLVAWIDRTLRAEVPRLPVDPGRVTVRRLTRAQWQNTVRDLLGVTFDASAFPADDLGYGFDTVGEALTFSTLHLEKYLAAAGDVARAVIDDTDPRNPVVRRFDAEMMTQLDGADGRRGDRFVFLSNSTIEQRLDLPRAGTYRVRVSAGGDQAGRELVKMAVRIGDGPARTFEVRSRRLSPFDFNVHLDGGQQRLSIAFLNDYYRPDDPDPAQRDRNLIVDLAEVIGPLHRSPVPPQAAWLAAALASSVDAPTLLRNVTTSALPRLWRRPVSAQEIERLVALGTAAVADGDSPLLAARLVLQAMLVSPNFLFRIEAGAVGEGGVAPVGVVEPVSVAEPVSGHVLTQRLAYLLWGSAPDDRLRQFADGGRFTDRSQLLNEVDRMLRDPRAESLATDFASQWLELRSLAERAPDPRQFGDFDDVLRRAMRRETELLFWAVLREDRDVRDLLDCDFTFVDRRLANFYGLPAPAADAGFTRITLPPEQRERGGVLGHASMHVLTSNPTRTSPVKRGKWILQNLLGQAPPPPPPGNDSFANEAAIDSSKTFREQLAMHREKKSCAVCHVRMDTLGFALERYDAIGRFHERDGGGVIDASGELPDGRVIDGLTGLKAVLRDDPAFVRTLCRKLFVYALGREPRPGDRLRLDLAVDELLQRDTVTLRDLVKVIVTDVAFTHRSVERR